MCGGRLPGWDAWHGRRGLSNLKPILSWEEKEPSPTTTLQYHPRLHLLLLSLNTAKTWLPAWWKILLFLPL